MSQERRTPDNIGELVLTKTLRKRAGDLIEKIRENQLSGQKLPYKGNSLIPLKDNDMSFGYGKRRRYIQIEIEADGSIRVFKMQATDYGMGMDTMSFEWEELIVSKEGGMRKVTRYYPESLGNTTVSINISDEESRRTLDVLSGIVNNAIRLKKENCKKQ